MKIFKSIAIGSVLLGLISTVQAEDGHARALQFNENFRAEQARLWRDGTSAPDRQQVAQQRHDEQQKRSDD